MKTWSYFYESIQRQHGVLAVHELPRAVGASKKSTGYLDETFEMIQRTIEGVDRACMEFALSGHFPQLRNEERICAGIRLEMAQWLCFRLQYSPQPGRKRALMIRPDPKLTINEVWRWLLVDAWYDFLGNDYLDRLALEVFSGQLAGEVHWRRGELPKSHFYYALLDRELWGDEV
jgi:hypothetical protein